jgi:hypothetical protein
MARQLGVAGDSRLWVGVLKLVRSDEDMESFEEADEEGRKCILHTFLGSATRTSIPCMHLCVVVWVLNCVMSLNFIVYACVVLL